MVAKMELAINCLTDKSVSQLTAYKYLNLALSNTGPNSPSGAQPLSCALVEKLVDIFNTSLLGATQPGLNSIALNSIKMVLDSIKDDAEFAGPVKDIALILFKHLITIGRIPQLQGSQKPCWEMISSLPDNILEEVLSSNEIKQIFSLVSQTINADIEAPVKVMISDIILRWLTMISSEELPTIAQDCLNVWFGYTFPRMFINDEDQRRSAIQTMDIILPLLKDIDYASNPKWMALTLELQEKKKYTPVLVQLFHSKNPQWRSIWCITLQLLAKDLKKNCLLINSVLPVLEQAFRDESTRKDAFYCWKRLINVNTMNEKSNPKFVKLLCTPLVTNNAKTAEMAVVKFDVWWQMVVNLKEDMQIYADTVLFPFLNFCFGCDNVKDQLIPGLRFPSLHEYSVSSLVQLLGHEESCEGCTEDRVVCLNVPIVNNIMFDSASKRWLEIVKSAIIIISEQMSNLDEEINWKQNLKCVWSSVLKLATKVVNPNLMVLIFRNILIMLNELSEKVTDNGMIAELLAELLIPMMVEKKVGYSEDFLNDETNYCDDAKVPPLRAMILLMLSVTMSRKKARPESRLLPLQRLVSLEIGDSGIEFCSWILVRLKNTEPSISLWCNLCEGLANSKFFNINGVYDSVLFWPLDKELEVCEVPKIATHWRKLYAFVTDKMSTHKKKTLNYFDVCLITYITQVSCTAVESRVMTCTYCISSIIKYQAINNSVSQVTHQPPALKILQELLKQLKKCNITVDIMDTIVEAADSVSSVLASYNKRSSTQEYLQTLKKTAELTLKTIHTCLQKTILMSQMSEYSKKLAEIFPSYLLPTFGSAYCQIISDIILVFARKNEEDIVLFKDILQQIYKCQSVDSSACKKLEKIINDKEPTDFKSPHQKSEGKSKGSKKAPEDSQEGVFVIIKPNWKFDPKKLTEHQKEILTRRKEDIPALYEDLSQSQDDYKMKTWKPTGYVNDETSESSKDQESRDASIPKENVKTASRDASIPKENVKSDEKLTENTKTEKKVLRDIPNPGLKDIINCLSPQSETVKTNKNIKSTSENAENDEISLVMANSPKVVNKMTSFQSRLEKSIKKLQEGSKKLDNSSKNSTELPANVSLAVSPIVKKLSDSNVSTETSPISKVPLDSSNMFSTPPKTQPSAVAGNDIVQNSGNSIVETTPIANKDGDVPVTLNITPNGLKAPESERPARQRKRPNKFDPDDVRYVGKRRASLSIADMIRRSGSERDDSSETSSVTSEICSSSESKLEDNTPTKERKKRLRLLKTLQIDTVDGHPNKDLFNLNESPSRRRKTDNTGEDAPVRKRRRMSVNIITTKEDDVAPQRTNIQSKKMTKSQKEQANTESQSQEFTQAVKEITEDGCTTVNKSKRKAVAKETSKSTKSIKTHSEKTASDSVEEVIVQSSNPDVAMNDEIEKSPPSQPMIISDESVIVIEPESNAVIEVSDQCQTLSTETKYPEITPIPKNGCRDVIELSDGEEYEDLLTPLPESEDVIQSSQDSSSNSTMTPRRIVAIINGKNKLSPSTKDSSTFSIIRTDSNVDNLITSDTQGENTRRIIAIINGKKKLSTSTKDDSTVSKVSNVIISDTQGENTPTFTSACDTLPITASNSAEKEGADKTTEAINSTMSTTVPADDISTQLIDMETQMHDSDSIDEKAKEIIDVDEKAKEIIDIDEKAKEIIDIDEKAKEIIDIDEKAKEIIDVVENDIVVDGIEIEDKKESLVTDLDVSIKQDSVVDLDKEDKTPMESIQCDYLEKETNGVVQLTDNEDEEKDDLINRSTILSSPYGADLEDRNAELLNSTLDISPIKVVTHESDNLKITVEKNELESLGCKILSDNESSDSDQASSQTSPIRPTEISPVPSPNKLSPSGTDKVSVSPDNTSPPRGISSPSSSMNQKKNRSLMTHVSGRAAQMLGLCKRDSDDKFKNVANRSPVRMIARKNLHSFYGSSVTTRTEEDLLEFTKTLPSPHASPSGSILRKSQSEQIPSPQSKKKRVSFHDPPVSKRLSIEKYIDTAQITRSPQSNKLQKNYNHEPASFMKQSKVVFCLAKKIDATISTFKPIDETLSETCSLEVETQPSIDLIDNALLDDEEEIYPSLANCDIPIMEIASDLTSESCRNMFLEEVRDDIITIGDLARLTELKVNRLPIRYPKVMTVLKVLRDFERTLQSMETSCSVVENDLLSEEMEVSPENRTNDSDEEVDDERQKEIVDGKSDVTEGNIIVEEPDEDVESAEEVVHELSSEVMEMKEEDSPANQKNIAAVEERWEEFADKDADVIEDNCQENVIVEEPDDNIETVKAAETSSTEVQTEETLMEQAGGFRNAHLIGIDNVDFANDEDVNKLLDKLLRKDSCISYLSNNLHKYLSYNINFFPKP